jgi:hypothetical protein
MPAGVSAYTALANITIGASQPGNVTFSSISQSYRDLVLVVDCANRDSRGGVLRVRVNGSGDSYTFITALGDGSGTNSSSGSGTYLNFSQNDMTKSTSRTVLIAEFFDYAQTDKQKQINSRIGNPSVANVMGVGRWAYTAAINSIYVEIEWGFAQGSVLSLYGVSA